MRLIVLSFIWIVCVTTSSKELWNNDNAGDEILISDEKSLLDDSSSYEEYLQHLEKALEISDNRSNLLDGPFPDTYDQVDHTTVQKAFPLDGTSSFLLDDMIGFTLYDQTSFTPAKEISNYSKLSEPSPPVTPIRRRNVLNRVRSFKPRKLRFEDEESNAIVQSEDFERKNPQNNQGKRKEEPIIIDDDQLDTETSPTTTTLTILQKDAESCTSKGSFTLMTKFKAAYMLMKDFDECRSCGSQIGSKCPQEEHFVERILRKSSIHINPKGMLILPTIGFADECVLNPLVRLFKSITMGNSSKRDLLLSSLREGTLIELVGRHLFITTFGLEAYNFFLLSPSLVLRSVSPFRQWICKDRTPIVLEDGEMFLLLPTLLKLEGFLEKFKRFGKDRRDFAKYLASSMVRNGIDIKDSVFAEIRIEQTAESCSSHPQVDLNSPKQSSIPTPHPPIVISPLDTQVTLASKAQQSTPIPIPQTSKMTSPSDIQIVSSPETQQLDEATITMSKGHDYLVALQPDSDHFPTLPEPNQTLNSSRSVPKDDNLNLTSADRSYEEDILNSSIGFQEFLYDGLFVRRSKRKYSMYFQSDFFAFLPHKRRAMGRFNSQNTDAIKKFPTTSWDKVNEYIFSLMKVSVHENDSEHYGLAGYCFANVLLLWQHGRSYFDVYLIRSKTHSELLETGNWSPTRTLVAAGDIILIVPSAIPGGFVRNALREGPELRGKLKQLNDHLSSKYGIGKNLATLRIGQQQSKP